MAPAPLMNLGGSKFCQYTFAMRPLLLAKLIATPSGGLFPCENNCVTSQFVLACAAGAASSDATNAISATEVASATRRTIFQPNDAIRISFSPKAPDFPWADCSAICDNSLVGVATQVSNLDPFVPRLVTTWAENHSVHRGIDGSLVSVDIAGFT